MAMRTDAQGRWWDDTFYPAGPDGPPSRPVRTLRPGPPHSATPHVDAARRWVAEHPAPRLPRDYIDPEFALGIAMLKRRFPRR